MNSPKSNEWKLLRNASGTRKNGSERNILEPTATLRAAGTLKDAEPKSKHYFYHIPDEIAHLQELQKARRPLHVLVYQISSSEWNMKFEYLEIAKIKHIFIPHDDLMQMQVARTNRYNGVQLNKTSAGIIFSFHEFILAFGERILLVSSSSPFRLFL